MFLRNDGSSSSELSNLEMLRSYLCAGKLALQVGVIKIRRHTLSRAVCFLHRTRLRQILSSSKSIIVTERRCIQLDRKASNNKNYAALPHQHKRMFSLMLRWRGNIQVGPMRSRRLGSASLILPAAVTALQGALHGLLDGVV